jgi:hypothetical protein
MEVHVEYNSRQAEELFRRAPAAVRRAMLAAANHTATDIHMQMQTYPPARAGSTYVRRNNLRASWLKRVHEQGGAVIAEIVSSGSVAPYNVWVQKHELQAAVHRGYWTNTDRMVVQRSADRVTRYFREELDRAAAILRT